jgi:hypothetical protein
MSENEQTRTRKEQFKNTLIKNGMSERAAEKQARKTALRHERLRKLKQLGNRK